MKTKLVIAIFATLIGVNLIGAVAPSSCHATYAFGDSNTDTGGSIAAGIFEMRYPHGITFPGYPDGRASDGRLIIDFLVESMGFPYLSPYLESIGSNFSRGANFAIGGATLLQQEGDGWLRPFDLMRQIKQLAHLKSRLLKSQGQGSNKLGSNLFMNSLFVIDIGQNDLSANLSRSDAEANTLIAHMMVIFSEAINRLSEQGAIHFWVHNTGPIGCMPSTVIPFKTKEGAKFDKHGCAIAPNALASQFNSELKSAISQLRQKLPHINLTYVDIYTAKYRLVSKAKKLGFVDPMNICNPPFGIAAPPIAGTPCENPEAHISWDGGHYTEAANRWVAKQILEGSLCDPPISFANACGSAQAN